MKKSYEKPVLYIERFTLTQTIAHNCGENLDFEMGTYATKETCGWNAGGIIIFMEGNENCLFPTKEFAGICYDAPAGGYNVFAS